MKSKMGKFEPVELLVDGQTYLRLGNEPDHVYIGPFDEGDVHIRHGILYMGPQQVGWIDYDEPYMVFRVSGERFYADTLDVVTAHF